MDAQLIADLHAALPSLSLPAATAHTHATWARTYHSRPELYLQPASIAEVQSIVRLARAHRRRIVTTGSAHSPNTLTLTSSWLLNLDKLSSLLAVDDGPAATMTVQAGMRLAALNDLAAAHGLTIPNLGSIAEQSLAGALATGTHGSTLAHGALGEKVRGFAMVLGDGSVARARRDAQPGSDEEALFRAGLVSVGALGVVVEVEYALCRDADVEWKQTIVPLDHVLRDWSGEGRIWDRAEFVRCWWLPYLKKAVVWQADKTDRPRRKPVESWYGGSVGFHTYHALLWASNRVPRILPWVEWFVFGMQYGFKDYTTTSAVGPMRTELLMDCLFSQFVNEWAVPLSAGPDIIRRLSAWINHEPLSNHNMPFSAAGLYVHSPIEVRVSDTTRPQSQPRPYLDHSHAAEPTLYLNATLYRPFHDDPPCRARYYEAFEWLMREYRGRPHWAKNFTGDSAGRYIREAYGEDLRRWRAVRDRVDPDGVFVGPWHRTAGLLEDGARYANEEREIMVGPARDGGKNWVGEVKGGSSGMAEGLVFEEGTDAEKRPRAVEDGCREGLTGRKVFTKM